MELEEPENGGLEVEEIPHGRRLTPIGDIYRTTQRDLEGMSDDELEVHILNLRASVRQAEQSLDYRRTKLIQAVGESEVRLDKIRRNWRASTVGRPDPITHTAGGIVISAKTHATTNKDKWQQFIGKLKAQGKSTAEIKDILEQLADIVKESNK